jgi:tripartite-type tricarboxylate transporter receptor subunit TctC
MHNTIAFMLASTALLLGSHAWGQTYPVKPIRIISTEPGGSLDLAARILAQGLGEAFKQNVIVENRPGAAGIISVEALRAAPADGYSLGFYSSAFWITPLLQPVPYEQKDFQPVVLAVSSPNVVVVHPSLPVKNMKELIALVKSKPGELSYGASSTGSGPHLAGELFKAMTKADVERIPYKGGAPTVNDLLAGRLQFAFTTPGTIAAFVKAGKLRALAVTSRTPSALLPDLPVVAETLPGFESATLQGMWAPAKVPRAIITRINQESVKFLTRQDTKDKFLAAGTEVAAGMPEDFEATVKSEVAKLGPVIRQAGIKAE